MSKQTACAISASFLDASIVNSDHDSAIVKALLELKELFPKFTNIWNEAINAIIGDMVGI